ncbi:hypothetical protein I350_01194 [Cryptococcus amylolentus CBS 6273]|uniref:Ima1 N-terminal domain-containing protein n=1 Tax=Cryptococcus amylolentus CBS 6273 TaxID=1296118 RepID=A0A1E3KDD2_9TREE|nr:hypothetical protein I350_01194 [Cryptococcus amylolentus CBS 6273]
MPLLRSSTHPAPVQCFFCLSTTILPPHTDPAPGTGSGKGIAPAGTKWNWQCERCNCWNIRDASGEMVSDIPAMHNSDYNTGSFSLRGRCPQPSSNHLPTLPSKASSTPFCRNCLANQTLIMNLLANYLPDDDDPTYPQLSSNLPAYVQSLHSRYPPVCPNCQPGVDDILQKADQKAQMEAWGSALNRGKRKAIEEVSPGAGVGHGTWDVGKGDVFIWALRGVLWTWGIGQSLCTGVLLATSSHEFSRECLERSVPFAPRLSFATFMMSFHLLSIFWIAWDPSWFRRMRRRDRTKVIGRDTWVRNMLVIMLLRIATCVALRLSTAFASVALARVTFVLEIALFIHALLSIRITEPIPIKLVRPVSLNPSTHAQVATVAPNPTGLSTLSLSSNPPACHNPIFGQTSLFSTLPSPTRDTDSEPMDWEPSPSVSRGSHIRPDGVEDEDEGGTTPPRKSDWDSFATNRQRMFPSNDETGLEHLLSGWGIGGQGASDEGSAPKVQNVRQEDVIKKQGWTLPKLVQVLTFFFFTLRLGFVLCMPLLLTPPSEQIVSHLGRFSILLLSLELALTGMRMHFLLAPGARQASLLSVGLAIFDAVLRVMALSGHGFLDDMPARTNPVQTLGGEVGVRGRSLEWAFWGFLDLVGLSV